MTSNKPPTLADLRKHLVVLLWVIFSVSAVQAQEESAAFSRPGDSFVTLTPNASTYVPPIYSFLGRDKETGFRLGRGRLHPALGIYNTYDANALYSDVNERSDMILRLITGLDYIFSTPRFYLLTGYRFTFRKNIENGIQDSLEHRANMETSYRLTRSLLVSIREKFEKGSDPSDAELLTRVGRWTNEAQIGAKYITPGEDLEVGLFYTNLYQNYDATLAALNFLSNKVSLSSRINVSSQFRFLPKTIAFGNVEYGTTSYNHVPATVTTNNSRGINSSFGLTSILTRKTSATVKAGFSSIFFSGGPDQTSVSGGASVQYMPTPLLSVATGYDRTSQVSTFTNFHNDHRINFDFTWKFARRFMMINNFRYMWVDYSGPNVTLGGEKRSDRILQDVYQISYAPLTWLTTRLEYQLDQRDTNALTGVAPFTQRADFLKHQVSLVFDFYY